MYENNVNRLVYKRRKLSSIQYYILFKYLLSIRQRLRNNSQKSEPQRADLRGIDKQTIKTDAEAL